ncbi:MAG TPA: LysR family transcriptional regulator [Gammaproteobacteria bacterium]|nr:LysR family transcriptional regulator [Gammaproteobacteria bacterium]
MPIRRPDTLQRAPALRSFCITAQYRSMTVAAERLGLSQPAVSLHVQTLERELGEILFERRGSRLTLTPAGTSLYSLALPVIEALGQLPAHFRAELGRIEGGEVSIAASGSTLLYLLPRYVERFAREHPDVDLRLHNVTGRDGLGLLRRDEADFALGPMLEVPDDLHYEPMFSFSHVLITPPDHPLSKLKAPTPADIAPYPLITPPHHGVTADMIDAMFRLAGVRYRVALETGGWDVIKRYVSLGLGCAIVSGVCLQPDDKLPGFRMDPWLAPRTYGIVVRRGKFLAPAPGRFIEMLKPEPLAMPWLSSL